MYLAEIVDIHKHPKIGKIREVGFYDLFLDKRLVII